MRKVIGIGETVLDIIFKNEQPITAKPGGSTFNALISLGRCAQNASFISEIGNDTVGDIIINFLNTNGVNSDYVYRYKDGKSALSLAFLNDKQDAEYTFYKDYPKQRIEPHLPEINEDDIVLFGSYFALNPQLRPIVLSLLTKAQAAGAIIYYDPNFRSSHLEEVEMLRPTLIENFKCADIVRGSDEDFNNILSLNSFDLAREKMKNYVSNFIYTRSSQGVDVFSNGNYEHFDVNQIKPLSTIGAGDNFNAGVVYALLSQNIRKQDLQHLSKEQWRKIIKVATGFSENVCLSYDNYISHEYASTLISE